MISKIIITLLCISVSVLFGWVWGKWGEWFGYEAYWKAEGFFYLGSFTLWITAAYIILFIWLGGHS